MRHSPQNLTLFAVPAITDCNMANDTIEVDIAIFNAIVGLGTLSAGQFVANASGTGDGCK